MTEPGPSSTDNTPPEIQQDLSPERFVRELWGISPKEYAVEFFLKWEPKINTDPDAKPAIRIMHYTIEQVFADFAGIFQNLQAMNKKYFNIHPCVNPRFQKPKKRGKNSDVKHYVALWVDWDFHGQETAVRNQIAEIMEILKQQDLLPSAVVESGHGVHLYWLLDRPYTNEEARPCCAGIQDFCKLSDAINDPSRVLRMPGTFNVKDQDNVKPCHVSSATWRRYPLEKFKSLAVEPSKSDEEVKEEKEQKDFEDVTKKLGATMSRDPKIEEIKKGVGESGGPYGGRHNAAKALAGHYASRMKAKKYVQYAMDEWNKAKCSPPIEDDQIKGLVEYAWNQEQLKRADQKDEDGKSIATKEHKDAPWWHEGKFKPQPLAQDLVAKNKFIATPIGVDKGIHVYVYENGIYRKKGASLIETSAREALGPDAKPVMIDQVLDLVRRMQKVDYSRLNPKAKDLVNVQNGMLNWRTGELVPHDPSYLSTFQLNAKYDTEAKCPELDKFLSDIFPADALLLAEEIIGYMMIPDTSMQKCFIAVGSGGNGKGTFLKVMQTFLGQENVSNLSIHKIEQDKFALSALFGKLANICHDLDSKILESTGNFKSIVSGDPISAEEKYQDVYSFEPFARIFFSANQFPRSMDRTEAFFRRLIFIPFPNRFDNRADCIPEYEKTLTGRADAMSVLLSRGIEGLRRLMKARKFTTPESSLLAIEEYRRECSSAYDYVQEHCVLVQDGWILRKEVYQSYHSWCIDEGMKPVGAKIFTKQMESMGGIKMTLRDGYPGWRGLSWKVGKPPETSSTEIKDLGKPTPDQPNLDF